MSFGGHVLDMIKRNNQNQELRKKHRASHKKIHAKSLLNADKIIYPKIAKEKLDKIKTEIRQKFKKERQTRTIKTIVISAIILTILFFVIRNGLYYLIDNAKHID